MVKPDYNGGGTLNLISSISEAAGNKTGYPILNALHPEKLKDVKNIVFLLIDGLGYEFIKEYGKNTIFNENMIGKMTTTFPSSTSAATTSLMTGQEPREHGMTAWHMFMKEIGTTIIPLPFVERMGRKGIQDKIEIKGLFNLNPFTSRIKYNSYLVQHKEILDSDFTKAAVGKKTKRIGYNDMTDGLKKVRKIIKSNNKNKFIFMYYNKHDSLCHDYGTTHKKVQKHFKQMPGIIENFFKSIEGTGTIVVITSDHGHMDIHKDKRIHVEDHPEMKECLTMPLCGEARFAYCYVKPSKEKQFVQYIKNNLKYCCNLYKSESLLNKGYFGIRKEKEHPNIAHRIGDYIILMKDNYGIYDRPAYNKREHYNIGDHGGLSRKEMIVPLIIVKK
ncbi:hypothetical protein CO038_02020 [Candidatus Pacearchaeota archaeon CG_4_9_14_0_2_um_filter_39_13]|nr:alkaline phosphatase family protein [Candidatus Pacearchaeota archaeon]OIO43874.1 MAG: hypothetical protein AUJ64_01080 [Candidatus Pacearchaeota archaeon CG1_02_39_14]PJC44723.1 MAG: hypothetical protein CO038_02020 [Candidatus Pacearchaeota archaeon CG_4_9_14_0_2_um_filter_39_13]